MSDSRPDDLDTLTSEELEEQAFGPDPDRKRRRRTRRGGARKPVVSTAVVPVDEPEAIEGTALPVSTAAARVARPVVTKFCYACGDEIAARAAVCPTCAVRQPEAPARLVGDGGKSKPTATFLALLFGGVGAHRFYLGHTKTGVAMLLFFWTAIPAVLGLVDFVRFTLMSDGDFSRRYDGRARALLVPPRRQRMIARPVRALDAPDDGDDLDGRRARASAGP